MSVLCGVKCKMLCSIGYCVVQVLLEVSSVVLSAKCCVVSSVVLIVKCCVVSSVVLIVKCCILIVKCCVQYQYWRPHRFCAVAKSCAGVHVGFHMFSCTYQEAKKVPKKRNLKAV